MPTRDDSAAPAPAAPAPSTAPPVVAPPGVHPLEPIFLARSVNLLAGTSGAGKTALLALLSRLFHARADVFTAGAPPRPVYQAYVGVDKSWEQSSRRWFALEGMHELPHYSLADDKKFQKRRLRTKTDRIAILEECLAKVSPNASTFPPGSVVYLDSGALFLGGNLLDYDACAVACMEVRELCQKVGDIALIATVHGSKIKADKKQGYARLQDHILGSAALYGYTDTQLYIASAEELRAKSATFLWAPHHGQQETFSLLRDPQGRYLSHEVSADVEASWIVSELAKAPGAELQFAALIRSAIDRGLSRATLARQLAREIGAGRVRKDRHGTYRLAGKH